MRPERVRNRPAPENASPDAAAHPGQARAARVAAGAFPISEEQTCLAFAGRGRDLVVAVAPDIDVEALQDALAIFLPRWGYETAPAVGDPDIAITRSGPTFRIAAVSWPGGESRADDPHNAANALAGLLIDGLLAHGMAVCALHAAATEIDGHAVLFAGPSESGKSTLALRLAARGHRHLADDRILLVTDDAPYRVASLGLAAKARQPLPPGPELAALVAARWQLADDTISYLHLEDQETVGFGTTRPLGAVVLPRRDAGLEGDARLERAAAGEIARTLIEETTSPAGAAAIVPSMSRLAEASRGFILHYRDGAAAAELLVSELSGRFT